jgi:hypothetical protein
MHLNGKNHKSKMKRSMGGVQNSDLETIQKRVQLKDSILSAVSKSKSVGSIGKRNPDYSVHRTPSGTVLCTVSVLLELQLRSVLLRSLQHFFEL